jgi:hypothetical protein
MRDRLVLAPQVSAADVAAALADWSGGATDLTPGLNGEPVSARWTRGEKEVRYSANPAIGLRTVEGSGVATVASRLPLLTGAHAVLLTGSSDRGEALLGITALGLLGDPQALPTLQRVAASADPNTRGTAEVAIRRIGMRALTVGAERVSERRRTRPEGDPVLGLLVPVSVRRQVLRQILADPPADRTRVRELLAAGLVDDDWEVRWSAVLGAHSHGVVDVLMAIRECALGNAIDSRDRETLEVVRDVVGHRLAGSRSAHPGASRIAALLDGADTDLDAALLLLTALRDPVPDEPPNDNGYVVVDAVPHWLGGRDSPIRRGTPAAPFAVAVVPEPAVEVDAVDARLRDLSARTGRVLRLPTADELEMATRGPDGRRFPWGNGRERRVDRVRSPWGLAQPLARPEWVLHADRVVAIPAAARHGCGAQPHDEDHAALRAVVSAENR